MTDCGGEHQGELGSGFIWTGLQLRIIPRKLRAIIRLAAGLEQIDMDFRIGSSSVRVNMSGTVDAEKGLRGISR